MLLIFINLTLSRPNEISKVKIQITLICAFTVIYFDLNIKISGLIFIESQIQFCKDFIF